MPAQEGIALAAAVLLPLLIAIPAVAWFRRRRRDEVFAGITPGEQPALGQQTTRHRVQRGSSEWSGPVTVRFTPPDAMTPGLVGTVIDGRADVVDISATLIDLAVRGYLRLRAVPADPEAPPPPPARGRGAKTTTARSDHDWLMTRVRPIPDGPLLPFEAHLLGRIFAQGDEASIGELKNRGFDLTMREAQVGLYREVVDRGWYAKHPRDRNRRVGCLGIPLLLVGVVLVLAGLAASSTDIEIKRLIVAVGAGLAITALILFIGMRGRTPRTAEGTAARIQALGFREYLTKAEAGQIRFEEARDLFSRYLPYAMVFGVADRWAKTFAEVAARAHVSGVGDAFFDLTWLDGVDLLGNLALGAGDLVGGVGDGIGGLGDAVSAVGDLDALGLADLTGVLGDGLGGFTDAVGDFASSASGLLDFGDGCGGCDGCDLGL